MYEEERKEFDEFLMESYHHMYMAYEKEKEERKRLEEESQRMIATLTLVNVITGFGLLLCAAHVVFGG